MVINLNVLLEIAELKAVIDQLQRSQTALMYIIYCYKRLYYIMFFI